VYQPGMSRWASYGRRKCYCLVAIEHSETSRTVATARRPEETLPTLDTLKTTAVGRYAIQKKGVSIHQFQHMHIMLKIPNGLWFPSEKMVSDSSHNCLTRFLFPSYVCMCQQYKHQFVECGCRPNI